MNSERVGPKAGGGAGGLSANARTGKVAQLTSTGRVPTNEGAPLNRAMLDGRRRQQRLAVPVLGRRYKRHDDICTIRPGDEVGRRPRY